MSNELILLVITALYTVCNALRLLSYVPQIVAVARENSGAHAISLVSWSFWLLSHAATALYCATVVKDPLLAAMMWGNTVGCAGVVTLTMMKRQRYGWRRLRSVDSRSTARVPT
ncbi:MAG TPA: hypothetical protein VNA44_13010 [Burkholderiaceae bacterium]|nr:hypothetical protein [Burkholderiaceae bacterium]